MRGEKREKKKALVNNMKIIHASEKLELVRVLPNGTIYILDWHSFLVTVGSPAIPTVIDHSSFDRVVHVWQPVKPF